MDFVMTRGGAFGSDPHNSNYDGRRCILLSRDKNTLEMENLAAAVGIEIVEVIIQRGKEDVRSYFGKGRLEVLESELNNRSEGHQWFGVDLVLMHTNASPVQLVEVGDLLGIECWDRIRLLLNLFTTKANSIDSKLQVRLAMLHADRAILREVVRQRTKGEHLGHGAGGRHALESVMRTIDRELASLERKRKKRASSRNEQRKRRSRQGAKSIGLVGYTNAGKSSLFQMMAGKPTLIEDRLFSTLDTMVGRLQKSPRILMIDTIGFVDNLPTILLDAFAATIDESADCELVLLVVDASDSIHEVERKLSTCVTELETLREGNVLDRIQIVLSKVDLISKYELEACIRVVISKGLSEPVAVSCVTERGISELRQIIMLRLYGEPKEVCVKPPVEEGHHAIAAIVAGLYEIGHVIDGRNNSDGKQHNLKLWVDSVILRKYTARMNGQIVMSSEQGGTTI